jgi:hypothetical protein
MKNGKFVNARPSRMQNLGEEVMGAHRHRNDTYDNPDRELAAKRERESKKEVVAQVEALKRITIAFMPEDPSLLAGELRNYEHRLFQVQNMHNYAFDVMEVERIKEWVLSKSQDPSYELLRIRFNRMQANKRKLRWVRTKDQGILHVRPAPRLVEAFQEKNGRDGTWTDSTLRLSPEVAEAVLTKARALQFGNTVPDAERVYVTYNLNLGVSWLQGLLPHFRLSNLAYAFGARGNARSVAYYQDGAKLISVNRHNEGSLVHEIGHAIDFHLGHISRTMPVAMQRAYREKIAVIDNRAYKAYLRKPTEVFARLFEVYIYRLAEQTTGQNYFMLYIDPTGVSMPVLDDEARTWLESCLAKLEVAP